jgi:hypothetical protein
MVFDGGNGARDLKKSDVVCPGVGQAIVLDNNGVKSGLAELMVELVSAGIIDTRKRGTGGGLGNSSSFRIEGDTGIQAPRGRYGIEDDSLPGLTVKLEGIHIRGGVDRSAKRFTRSNKATIRVSSGRDSARDLKKSDVVSPGVGQAIVLDDNGVKSGLAELMVELVSAGIIDTRKRGTGGDLSISSSLRVEGDTGIQVPRGRYGIEDDSLPGLTVKLEGIHIRGGVDRSAKRFTRSNRATIRVFTGRDRAWDLKKSNVVSPGVGHAIVLDDNGVRSVLAELMIQLVRAGIIDTRKRSTGGDLGIYSSRWEESDAGIQAPRSRYGIEDYTISLVTVKSPDIHVRGSDNFKPDFCFT